MPDNSSQTAVDVLGRDHPLLLTKLRTLRILGEHGDDELADIVLGALRAGRGWPSNGPDKHTKRNSIPSSSAMYKAADKLLKIAGGGDTSRKDIITEQIDVSEARQSSLTEVEGGSHGELRVFLGPAEWLLRCKETASCACICQEGKVRHGVCMGSARRCMVPVWGRLRSVCCCQHGAPRHALGQSTAFYSAQSGVITSTNVVAEQTISSLAFTATVFALGWTLVLLLGLVFRLSDPQFAQAKDLALGQNILYVLVAKASIWFPGSFRYDTTTAMVLGIIVFLLQCVRLLLRRQFDQLQVSTVSVADKLLAISAVEADRFFISYKWGHPGGEEIFVSSKRAIARQRWQSLNSIPASRLRVAASEQPVKKDVDRAPAASPPTCELKRDWEMDAQISQPFKQLGKQDLKSTSGAEGLARSLARALPSTWIDVMRLPNAASLHRSIYTDIQGALSTIILMTPGYLGSVNCNFELLCLLRLHAQDKQKQGGKGIGRLTQGSRVVVYLPEDGDLPGLEWYSWDSGPWMKYDRRNLLTALQEYGVSVVERGHELIPYIHNRMFMGLADPEDAREATVEGWGHGIPQTVARASRHRSSPQHHQGMFSCCRSVVPQPSDATMKIDMSAITSVHQWWLNSSRTIKSAKSNESDVIVPVAVHLRDDTTKAWLPCLQHCYIARCEGHVCPRPASVVAGHLWISPDGVQKGTMWRLVPGAWPAAALSATILYGVGHFFYAKTVLDVPTWLWGIDPPLFYTALALLVMSILIADGVAELNWKFQHSPCLNKILLARSLHDSASYHDDDESMQHVLTKKERLRFAFMLGGEDQLRDVRVPSDAQEGDNSATPEELSTIRVPDAVRSVHWLLQRLDLHVKEFHFDKNLMYWEGRELGELAAGGQRRDTQGSSPGSIIGHTESAASRKDDAVVVSPLVAVEDTMLRRRLSTNAGLYIQRVGHPDSDHVGLDDGVVYCFVISTPDQGRAYLSKVRDRSRGQVVLLVHSDVPRAEGCSGLYDLLHVRYSTDGRIASQKHISCLSNWFSYVGWRFGLLFGSCGGCRSDQCCGSNEMNGPSANQKLAESLLEALSSKIPAAMHGGGGSATAQASTTGFGSRKGGTGASSKAGL